METFAKKTENRIALSVASMSSFMISSFKKYKVITPGVCAANVPCANATQAIINGQGFSSHRV
jgi:hypothetical protein